MNPDLSRRAARAMQNAALTPSERVRLGQAVEAADSWDTLPEWARTQIVAAEQATGTQEQVGEQLLRRTTATQVVDDLT